MMSGLKSPHGLIASSFLLLAFSASFAVDEPTKPDQKTATTLSFGGIALGPNAERARQSIEDGAKYFAFLPIKRLGTVHGLNPDAGSDNDGRPACKMKPRLTLEQRATG
jgi:hypothetical protein